MSVRQDVEAARFQARASNGAAAEPGINPRVIQFLAGWTSLRMLERNGHVRDTEVRRAVTANAERLNTAATRTAHSGKTNRRKFGEVDRRNSKHIRGLCGYLPERDFPQQYGVV